MQTSIAMKTFAGLIAAAAALPWPANAAATQKTCCRWDPTKAATCLMYCPGSGATSVNETAAQSQTAKKEKKGQKADEKKKEESPK